MKKTVRLAAALLALAAWTSPADRRPPFEAETLAALARLYGVVRWFHPTDAAQEIDWNRFAVHAVREVQAARTPGELKRRLEELFAPVAVGLVVDRQLPPSPPPRPASTEKLVAWRHLGLGFGGKPGGIYRSARTHRRAAGEEPIPGGLMQAVPAAGLRGKTVRLSGLAKAEPAGPDGAAALWLRVDRGLEVGFADAMENRPIRDPAWRSYAIEGPVADDATQVAFGVMSYGPGRAGFDAFRLEVREQDGSWRSVPIEDPGFEGEQGWQPATMQEMVATRESDGPPEGRLWLALTLSGQPLFEAPLRADDSADFDLGLGLRARVPLVLTDAEASIGAGQRSLLNALRSQLAALPQTLEPADPAVRAADVIVAWSALRHFYPYWTEAGVDWDARLGPLLEEVAAAGSRAAHRDLLRRLAVEFRDGHGRVADPQAPPQKSLPIALRWLAEPPDGGLGAQPRSGVSPQGSSAGIHSRREPPDGRLVVLASSVPEVRGGDVIVSADGRAAAAWFAEAEALQSGSPHHRRWRAARALFWGAEGSRVRLEVEREAARVHVELARGGKNPWFEPRPEPMAELRPGVWYVDLERAKWAEVKPRLPELARAAAVVFDVRGYPSDAGAEILPHLMTQPEHDPWMHTPRIARPFGRDAGWQSSTWHLKPALPRIPGKVAFLADARAVSYAESVLGYVEALRLGTIVGGPTAGANGNAHSFTLPSGMSISFTGMRVTRHDGSPFHLVGVRPTVPVEPTLAGIRAGRDEVLERALAIVAPE